MNRMCSSLLNGDIAEDLKWYPNYLPNYPSFNLESSFLSVERVKLESSHLLLYRLIVATRYIDIHPTEGVSYLGLQASSCNHQPYTEGVVRVTWLILFSWPVLSVERVKLGTSWHADDHVAA